jgi:hypothetical protein
MTQLDCFAVARAQSGIESLMVSCCVCKKFLATQLDQRCSVCIQLQRLITAVKSNSLPIESQSRVVGILTGAEEAVWGLDPGLSLGRTASRVTVKSVPKASVLSRSPVSQLPWPDFPPEPPARGVDKRPRGTAGSVGRAVSLSRSRTPIRPRLRSVGVRDSHPEPEVPSEREFSEDEGELEPAAGEAGGEKRVNRPGARQRRRKKDALAQAAAAELVGQAAFSKSGFPRKG